MLGLRWACGVGTLAMVGCVGKERAVEAQSSVEALALEESIARVEAGDLMEGISALSELGSAEDGEVRVEALRWLGHAHTRNVDPDAALAAYREAAMLEPGDAWLKVSVRP